MLRTLKNIKDFEEGISLVVLSYETEIEYKNEGVQEKISFGSYNLGIAFFSTFSNGRLWFSMV